MTGPPPPPPIGAPVPPPPFDPPATTTDRVRPYWGGIDLLFALLWWVASIIVVSIVTGIAVGIGGGDLNDLPVYALFFGTLAFQISLAVFPWLISKLKGLGMASDWGFTFKLPDDILIGIAIAIACLLGAQVVTLVIAELVGLENIDDASNTDFLSDNQGSPWIAGLILMAVIGAPIAEELMFRGFLLRVIRKYLGPVLAVILSSIPFALLHIQPGATWQESVVLLSALGAVGAILGFVAALTNRLGPAILAHLLFNLVGTVFTLLPIDEAMLHPY